MSLDVYVDSAYTKCFCCHKIQLLNNNSIIILFKLYIRKHIGISLSFLNSFLEALCLFPRILSSCKFFNISHWLFKTLAKSNIDSVCQLNLFFLYWDVREREVMKSCKNDWYPIYCSLLQRKFNGSIREIWYEILIPSNVNMAL